MKISLVPPGNRVESCVLLPNKYNCRFCFVLSKQLLNKEQKNGRLEKRVKNYYVKLNKTMGKMHLFSY